MPTMNGMSEPDEPTSETASPEPKTQGDFFLRAAEKVRTKFPTTPGCYLFLDQAGRVLYVGKAKNLKVRASSYFLKAAAQDQRTEQLVKEAYDIDFMDAESEVDALLMEARLVKDVQPKFNRDLRDDKSFPYLQITTYEDFPRVEITREPRDTAAKLYGPFANVGQLRGAVQVLQRVFQFRNCSLDIEENDEKWRWFRPCLLASIKQCTAPCNLRIGKEEYRKDITRLRKFLDGQGKSLLKEMRAEMEEASKNLRFEQAARLRDELKMLASIHDRGDLEKHEQPEVFYVDPKKGLAGLQKIFKLPETPRTIEGVDIAHLGGTETVASLVQFIDGLPFKPGYRRFKIREVDGIDDYASIHEVVSRRFKRLSDEGDVFPDILLIDGGKGQLKKAVEAFEAQGITPPLLLSLAKKEELVYRMGKVEPIKISRHAFALRLLQYVRDESHRFAQHYHHLLRRKKTLGEK
ncbi:UvrB/UvrC motif-containing protein [Adhaeretor mobilis]|uniref:UvrABC system protein C n=1 Tax=Adhaeretor mobilis TaxID=1930276 RepID=A0A517MT85_9BACT|nr:excinuclease ABC subunit UvrC [Adhaeretor mobilis]QDS98088.1 UvrABC system protein C [Adhaeretor mobilis]